MCSVRLAAGGIGAIHPCITTDPSVLSVKGEVGLLKASRVVALVTATRYGAKCDRTLRADAP